MEQRITEHMSEQTQIAPVLIVEDNDDDFAILEWAMRKLAIPALVYRCVDGDQALDFLFHRGEYTQPAHAPRPALILLDLHMEAVDGISVLAQLKNDTDLKTIPVIVWSGSTDRQDVNSSFRQGANSYVIKPVSTETLLHNVEMLNEYWFGVSALPDVDGQG